MKQYLSQMTDVLENSKTAENFFKALFSTSADVMMEASGLRLEAICVIAREQGDEFIEMWQAEYNMQKIKQNKSFMKRLEDIRKIAAIF